MPPRNNKSAAKRAIPALALTRTFTASRRLVYEAWTKDGQMRHWSSPHGIKLAQGKSDVRPGGKWSALMITPDGEKLKLSGVYREVVPMERLVFTHAWEENGQRGHKTIVTVRFMTAGKMTRMIFRQAPFDHAGSREDHKGGWIECFERLASFLSTGPKTERLK